MATIEQWSNETQHMTVIPKTNISVVCTCKCKGFDWFFSMEAFSQLDLQASQVES
jgi:hypothetical protein